MTYRQTRHRVVDAAGNDTSGMAALSLIWVARAAAEETLQGGAMGGGWLRLFSHHLSTADSHWLRWRGDLAESAELRRAYSGLYGRFFARALLSHHLGLSRFIPLARNGVDVAGSIRVARSSKGDIPDWIAWSSADNRFVLCEAKGSLTGNDFLKTGTPRCVREGKKQFGRVTAKDGARLLHPDEWVAGIRWATEERPGEPVTVLWDPPVERDEFEPDDAARHQAAMGRAWLESIAPGMGRNPADLSRAPEQKSGLVKVQVRRGAVPENLRWPDPPEPPDGSDSAPFVEAPFDGVGRVLKRFIQNPDTQTEPDLYSDRILMSPRASESADHEGEYIMSLVTRFGVRPLRTAEDFRMLEDARSRAVRLEEPAMVIGLPTSMNPAEPDTVIWQDEAGIAANNGLSVFDLRVAQATPL